MSVQEFNKERKSYKVGYCVKLNKVIFPSKEIYTITKLTTNINRELCYVLDNDVPNIKDRTFHYSYVFRDDECKRMERKNKLDAIEGR